MEDKQKDALFFRLEREHSIYICDTCFHGAGERWQIRRQPHFSVTEDELVRWDELVTAETGDFSQCVKTIRRNGPRKVATHNRGCWAYWEAGKWHEGCRFHEAPSFIRKAIERFCFEGNI